MKEKKITIMRVVLLVMMVGVFIGMWIHVKSAKEQLESIQEDLIYVEVGRMTREESVYLSREGSEGYTSSDAIHPEGAYLWAFPYIIVDVVLMIVYVVKYRT